MKPFYGHLPERGFLGDSGVWKSDLSRFILNSVAYFRGLEKPGWVPVLLALFYGLGLAGQYSLGKLLVVSAVGLWLSLGGVYRIGKIPAAYLGVLTLCTALSIDPWLSFWGLHGTFNTGFLCAAVLVPFWTSVKPSDHKQLERGLRVGAMASAVIAVFQHTCNFGTWGVFGNRSYAMMGSPIYLGALLAMAAPFSVSIPEIAVYGAGIWACGSRGAVLAAGAGLAYRHWRRLPRWVWAAAGPVVLAVVLRLRGHTSASDTGRLLVWAGALQTWRHHPFFGLGTGSFLVAAEQARTPAWDAVYGVTTQDYAHNLIFEALSSTGLFGLLALLGFCAVLWRRSNRATRGALVAVGIVGLLEPLPMPVKAMALALPASCNRGEETRPTAPWSIVIFFFSCKFFFSIALLICWDQLVLRYADAAWSFSSVKAAFWLGLVRRVAATGP